MSPVELAAGAARAALIDCGADFEAVAAALDTVAGVRQFEISGRSPRPSGAVQQLPAVGGRPPRRAARPRDLGDRRGPGAAASHQRVGRARSPRVVADVALVFGSDATSTLRHFATPTTKAENKPDFTETVDGDLEDRGLRHRETHLALHRHPRPHHCADPVRVAGKRPAGWPGLRPAEYRRKMGELFAPFTKIAANNPFAAAPVERTVDELITVTESNRMISEPYPRLMVARDQVNQGAAVLLMSVEAARRLGVPEETGCTCMGAPTWRSRPCWSVRTFGTPVGGAGGARSARDGRHRHRRRRHVRSVQLLSGAGVQHLRRHGDCARRSARTDPHRRAAVLRRRRQQLLDACHRRDGRPNAKPPGAIRSRRRQRRHPEQVLRRRLFDHPAAWKPDRSAELQAQVGAWPAHR